MGREARRNNSSEFAAVRKYQKPERVTVARQRRARRAELRDMAARMVAGLTMRRMAEQAVRNADAEHAARLEARAGIVLTDAAGITQSNPREIVSGD